MEIIKSSQLTKVYSSNFGKNTVAALSNLDLEVGNGTIFGFLGPNGAGKTTFIKMLLGIAFPTSGSLRVFGREASDYKIKEKIGYLPENIRLPQYLTGEEFLKHFGKLSGLEGSNLNRIIDEKLEIVKMTKWRKTKIKAYSKGMMQRLGLAQALMNNPDLILLDEPTDGVDPMGRKEIRDVLTTLKDQGKTVFINSHILSEVELITDRVAIINKGRLIREGSVKELTEKGKECLIAFENGNNTDYKKALEGFVYSSSQEGIINLQIKDNHELNQLIDRLRNEGILISSIIPRKETLEETFISIIKESEGVSK